MVRLSLAVVWLCSVAACGKIPVSEIDGGPGDDIDAGADQPDATPEVGTATLRAFHDDGTPVVNATVVQTAGGGQFITSTTTDADGESVLEVTEGDIVHVGWLEGSGGSSQSKRLYSVLTVQPDDTLEFNKRKPSNTSTNLQTVTVTLPGAFTGASSYQIEMGCTSTQLATPTPQTMQLRTDCVNPADDTFTVLGRALNDQGKVLATSVKTQGSTASTVVLPAWQSPQRVTLTMMNVPPNLLSSLELQLFKGALTFERASAEAITQFEVFYGGGYATEAQYFANVVLGTDASSPDGVLIVVQKMPAASLPSTVSIDMAATLPRIFKTSYEVGSSTLLWMMEGSAQQQNRVSDADALIAFLQFTDGAGTESRWTILSPANIGTEISFQLYDLVNFGPTADTPIVPVVTMFDFDVIDGYRDFKQVIGTNLFEGGIDALPAFFGVASFSGQGID